MNAKRVLIDTSAWIEYFRHSRRAVTQQVAFLVSTQGAVTSGVILGELFQGALNAEEVEAIRKLRDAVASLGDSTAMWEEAGLLARDLRRRGHTIALIDCYLAVLAHANHCAILSLDQHFLLIARQRPLEVLPIGG